MLPHNISDRIGEPDENGCMNWTGYIRPDGYGYLSTKSLPQNLAHRLVWHYTNGAIADEITLDHLCRNHACVNLDHIELVTFKENVLRGTGVTAINSRKTHCKHGHEFTEKNTMGNGIGGRKCRECHNKLQREKGRCKRKEQNDK